MNIRHVKMDSKNQKRWISFIDHPLLNFVANAIEVRVNGILKAEFIFHKKTKNH